MPQFPRKDLLIFESNFLLFDFSLDNLYVFKQNSVNISDAENNQLQLLFSLISCICDRWFLILY